MVNLLVTVGTFFEELKKEKCFPVQKFLRFSFLTAMMNGLKAMNFSASKISFLKSMPWHYQAVWAAANSCGFQGYTGERDSSDVRGFVHPLLGKRRPEGKPEGILEMCVIPALRCGHWNCFDLIYFFLTLQHLVCKLPKRSY